MRVNLPKAKLAPEYGGLLLWLEDERGGLLEEEIPPELEGCPEIIANLERIRDIYDSLFIDTEIEFSWKGFNSEAELEQYKELVRVTLTMLHEKLDGKYRVVDRTRLDRTTWLTPDA